MSAVEFIYSKGRLKLHTLVLQALFDLFSYLQLFQFSMTPISFVFASTTSAVILNESWQNSKSFRLLKFENPSSGSKVTDLLFFLQMLSFLGAIITFWLGPRVFFR